MVPPNCDYDCLDHSSRTAIPVGMLVRSTPGTRGLGLQLVDTEKPRKSGRGKSCHAAIREAGDSPGHKAGGTFLPFIMVWVSGGHSDSEMQMCLLERRVGNHPCKAGKAAGLGRPREKLNCNCNGDAVRAQQILQEPKRWEGSAWLFFMVAKDQSGRGLSLERRGSVEGSSLYRGQRLRRDSTVSHRAGALLAAGMGNKHLQEGLVCPPQHPLHQSGPKKDELKACENKHFSGPTTESETQGSGPSNMV